MRIYIATSIVCTAYNCLFGFYGELVSNEPPKWELETLIFVFSLTHNFVITINNKPYFTLHFPLSYQIESAIQTTSSLSFIPFIKDPGLSLGLPFLQGLQPFSQGTTRVPFLCDCCVIPYRYSLLHTVRPYWIGASSSGSRPMGHIATTRRSPRIPGLM